MAHSPEVKLVSPLRSKIPFTNFTIVWIQEGLIGIRIGIRIQYLECRLFSTAKHHLSADMLTFIHVVGQSVEHSGKAYSMGLVFCLELPFKYFPQLADCRGFFATFTFQILEKTLRDSIFNFP